MRQTPEFGGRNVATDLARILSQRKQFAHQPACAPLAPLMQNLPLPDACVELLPIVPLLSIVEVCALAMEMPAINAATTVRVVIVFMISSLRVNAAQAAPTTTRG